MTGPALPSPATNTTCPCPPPASLADLQAASATKQGGDKDARLQYLSWRIWFMKRRHAMVQQARRVAEAHEEDSLGAATEGGTSEYNSEDEEAAAASKAPTTPRSAVPLAAAAVAELMGAPDASDITREAIGAAEVTDVFPSHRPAARRAAEEPPAGAGEVRPRKALQISTVPREPDRRIDTGEQCGVVVAGGREAVGGVCWARRERRACWLRE